MILILYIYIDPIKSNQLLYHFPPLDLTEIKSQPLKLTKITSITTVQGSSLQFLQQVVTTIFFCPLSPTPEKKKVSVENISLYIIQYQLSIPNHTVIPSNLYPSSAHLAHTSHKSICRSHPINAILVSSLVKLSR
ncbi:hypothetical protein Hanom_Chr08g00698461 [Helianthus anomalus]